jgi:hypothetical protein
MILVMPFGNNNTTQLSFLKSNLLIITFKFQVQLSKVEHRNIFVF